MGLTHQHVLSYNPKITPKYIKNFFSNNYTYGIMGGVGKNTTTNIYIGVRINE